MSEYAGNVGFNGFEATANSLTISMLNVAVLNSNAEEF
jgi:hypothetical protein